MMAEPPTLEDGLAGLGHRERLLGGMAASIKEKGFRETTVADVVRIARTSRRTFYEHFEDREACFLALFDLLSKITMRHIEHSVDPTQPWNAQVDAAIHAYLSITQTEPELVQSYVDEIASVGERGLTRQRAVNDRFADLLVRLVEQGRRSDPDQPPLSQDAAILIVAGMRELTARAVDEDRDLLELQPVVSTVIKAVLRP